MDSDRAQRVALHRRRTAALYGGLERVSRDMGGLFEKIYPWNKSLDEPLRVEIDPRRAFGRPVVKVSQRLRALGVDARVLGGVPRSWDPKRRSFRSLGRSPHVEVVRRSSV